MNLSPIITLNNARLAHSGGLVFSGLSLSIHEGDRIALVGKNGAGKTSLLTLLAGETELSAGTLSKRRNLRIGYVSQFISKDRSQGTVRRAVENALQGQSLAMPIGHWVECLAAQFDFPLEMLDMTFSQLSGGWVNRAVLLCEMAKEPDILLLDEPTNHMDIEGIKEFEGILADRVSCAIFMVCHDVDVLDRVCTSTWFMRNGEIESFNLPYSAAINELKLKDEAREERRRAQLKEIDRVREAAKTLSTWGKVYHNEKFARRAKSMEKRVERMEGSLQSIVRERHGNVAIARREIDADWLVHVPDQRFFTPDGRALFKTSNVYFGPGERIVILGANGTGKSTFVRALMHSYRNSDETLRFNPRLSIGYYDQDLGELESAGTIFRYMRDEVTGLDDASLRRVLIDAGFPFEEQNKPVAVCSGGEKARLLLLRLRLASPNFLVLDEPTNHLDVYGINALAEQLVEKDIPAVIVTHNRSFARMVGTRFFKVFQGQFIETCISEVG